MDAKQQKIERQKRIMAIFIAVIFVGSIGGLALYGTGPTSNGAKLPEQRILETPLDLQQKQLLFANYGAYITANIPNCGFECDSLLASFSELTSRYHPFVYLYGSRASEEFLIIVEGFNGTRSFNDLGTFDMDTFEDVLCSNLHQNVPECKARKILLGI